MRLALRGLLGFALLPRCRGVPADAVQWGEGGRGAGGRGEEPVQMLKAGAPPVQGNATCVRATCVRCCRRHARHQDASSGRLASIPETAKPGEQESTKVAAGHQRRPNSGRSRGDRAERRRQAGGGGSGNPPLLQLRLSLRQGLLSRGHHGLPPSQLPQPAGGRGSGVAEEVSRGDRGGANGLIGTAGLSSSNHLSSIMACRPCHACASLPETAMPAASVAHRLGQQGSSGRLQVGTAGNRK